MVNVSNLKSDRSGDAVANQFDIITDDARYFQSYRSLIVKRTFGANSKVSLDRDSYVYSRTTIKYRNQWLNEDSKTIEKKIKSGEYELVDLN